MATTPPPPTPGRHSDGLTMAVMVPVMLLQQLLGALTFPVAKFGLDEIQPFVFAFFRFTIASTLLLLIVWSRKREPKIERRDMWRIFGLGLIIIPFNQVAYLVGQSLTGAGHGSLLFAITPIFVAILAVVHLGERLRLRRAVGIAIAVTGVIIIMTAGAVKISTEYLWGDLIILLAVVAWAYYTVLGRPLAQRYGALRVTAYALSFGSLLYFPFGLWQASVFEYAAVPVVAWGSVLYVAIGTSILAYVLYYWILKQWEASRLAVWHNVQPVIASLIAYFWLGEPLGWSFVIGGAVAIGGVLLAEL